MPVLPIPMIIALLLFGFLINRILTRETHKTLLALICCCTIQSAIIALVQYYGFTSLRAFQPLFATLIPAILWIAFSQAARGNITLRNTLIHSIGFLLAIGCLIFQPELLDILIPVLFVVYGAAIILWLVPGENSLPHSLLENGRMPILVWRVLGGALIVSAATDVFIAFSLAAGDDSVLLWVPSVFSSLTLLILGVLSLSYSIESRSDGEIENNPFSQEDVERDQTIITKLDQYVFTNKPFLDPDLTLARLSRKLLIPEKQLSSAINKLKGENVSRYINEQRIKHACMKMLEGHSVTDAMLSSGFNTKSNFNREFLRVHDMSPSTWMQSQTN